MMDQVVPFHDSTKFCGELVDVKYSPTAMQLVELVHDTSLRMLRLPSSGLG